MFLWVTAYRNLEAHKYIRNDATKNRTSIVEYLRSETWTVMSLMIMPPVVCLLMAFVHMLSTRGAVFLVIFAGLFIRGRSTSLYIMSTNVRVPMWLSCVKMQNKGIHIKTVSYFCGYFQKSVQHIHTNNLCWIQDYDRSNTLLHIWLYFVIIYTVTHSRK